MIVPESPTNSRAAAAMTSINKLAITSDRIPKAKLRFLREAASWISHAAPMGTSKSPPIAKNCAIPDSVTDKASYSPGIYGRNMANATPREMATMRMICDAMVRLVTRMCLLTLWAESEDVTQTAHESVTLRRSAGQQRALQRRHDILERRVEDLHSLIYQSGPG